MEKQLTTIAQAIRDKKIRVDMLKASLDEIKRHERRMLIHGRIQEAERTIRALEKLLPKEADSHIDFAAAYKSHVFQYEGYEDSPRGFFNHTFKQEP